MSQPPHILVVDSGVGALSIIAELRQRLPSVSITYASDNGFYPYGTKPEDELVQRVHRLFDCLVDRCQPDMAVVACNTASTVALPRIREDFSLPVVGVVPAIKPAAGQTRSGVIGLLATPATVQRPYTDELIHQYARGCDIIRLGSSELVELAEARLRGEIPNPADLEALLQPMLRHPRSGDMDTIVLACTHFPLLKAELAPFFSGSLHWLDSGDAIARRVDHLLNEGNFNRTGQPKFASLFTRRDPRTEQLLPALAQRLPGTVDYISLD